MKIAHHNFSEPKVTSLGFRFFCPTNTPKPSFTKFLNLKSLNQQMFGIFAFKKADVIKIISDEFSLDWLINSLMNCCIIHFLGNISVSTKKYWDSILSPGLDYWSLPSFIKLFLDLPQSGITIYHFITSLCSWRLWLFSSLSSESGEL